MTQRYRRKRPNGLLLLIGILLAIAARFGYLHHSESTNLPQASVLHEGPCEIVRVVDGDTLIVRQSARVTGSAEPEERVEARLRLLGIDCPESVKPDHPVERWGPESSEFTRKFTAGGSARLQFDKRRQDRFGRFLAYVYVGDRMLNEELILSGLARAKTYQGDSATMERRFKMAEQEARDAKKGIWSSDP